LRTANASASRSSPIPPAGTPRKDLRQLGFLFSFLKPYKGRIAIALIALALGSTTVLMIGQGLKFVIDSGFRMGSSVTLNTALAALFAMIAVLGCSTYVRFYNIFWVTERLTADLRKRLFDHILRLSPHFFESTRTGEVISRLTNDTSLVEAVVVGAFSYALRNLVLLLGGFVMLVVTSGKLTLLVVACIPFVLVPIFVLGRRVRTLSREQQDRIADISTYVDEALHEIRTVQAYAHEAIDRREFGIRAENVFTTAMRRALFLGGLIAAVIMLAFGSVGLILWVGGHDVIAGRLSAGELSAFVFYAILVANGVYATSEVYGELQRAAGASERLQELLNTPPAILPPAEPIPMPPQGAGHVALTNVTFHYPTRPDTPALSEISLEVRAGELVALVGPSGAGKTTIFQLLLRFYDPSQGTVRIDGVDVRAADPVDVRTRIALVSQDPVIFAASVAENVRYGRPEATDAEVAAACEAAYATEFISKLPQAMATPLGERGAKLSGGQRQRIAIARAILANRSILLLDEATSNLDSESESAVQAALEKAMQGRTTLVIAHRLATVQNADRIVVLEAGRIVGIGTHNELMATNPLYTRLAQLQFQTGASARSSPHLESTPV
jgi:ATP-binding cassette, subfamily B, bacterial